MVNIKNSKNKVYSEYFAENTIVNEWNKKGLIYPSWHGKPSENSFRFQKYGTHKNAIPSILISLFVITNKELFVKKYQEAISGDGEEWKRITTLHSSSLAALLFFYSVSEENPLYINGYRFSDSFFEVKTKVYEGHNSNMDVVLRGFDSHGSKVVLFLECKLSEYLNTGKYDNISKTAYEKIYESLSLFNKSIIDTIIFLNEKDKICIKPSKKTHIYCGGIKQMLSHYIGVKNYSEQRAEALLHHSRYTANEEEKVLLGEIVFDFEKDFSEKKLRNYKAAYKALAERINSNNNNIKMFGEILTYQEVFKHNNDFIKEQNIKNFYNL